jgi:hypothetical protein
MGSAPKGVEDLEPGQAARDGHEWIRPASEPLFTRTSTWAACHVDGFRCSLVAHRDVAGASRLALFISARLYGSSISPATQVGTSNQNDERFRLGNSHGNMEISATFEPLSIWGESIDHG